MLVISETTDLASDLIVLELERRGRRCIRFNQDRLGDITASWEPTSGIRSIHTGSHRIDADELTGVWYRRTTVSDGRDWRDAFTAHQWRAFIEGASSGTRAVNDPLSTAAAQNKLHQLRLASSVGLPIPDTLVTNSPIEAVEMVRSGASVIKAIVSGGGQDADGNTFMLPTTNITEDELDPDALRLSPVIIQRRVPASSHLRLTVIDNTIFAAKITVLGAGPDDIDWRIVSDERLAYDTFDCPTAVADSVRGYVASLGVRYAAVDLIESINGELVFLEANPGGQWGWLENRLDMPITATIASAILAENLT